MYADIKWACNFGILHNNRGTEPETTNSIQSHLQTIGSQHYINPGACILYSASSSGDPMNNKGKPYTKDSASAVYTDHIVYDLRLMPSGTLTFELLQQVINSTNTSIIPEGRFVPVLQKNIISAPDVTGFKEDINIGGMIFLPEGTEAPYGYFKCVGQPTIGYPELQKIYGNNLP